MNLLIAAVNLDVGEGEGFYGTGLAQNFVNGIGFYGLIFCLVGLILSAGLWAIGSFSNNYTQSVNGKRGFLVTAGAALVIGASASIINYFSGDAVADL